MAGLRTHLAAAELVLNITGSDTANTQELKALRGILHAPDTRDAFFSGAIFPDWGWRIHNEASEMAHWSPFTDKYTQNLVTGAYVYSHIRYEEANYPKYAAFLMGVYLHDITDDPWHFDLPMKKSFLTEARERDGLSHGDCEAYCDIFLQGEREMPAWNIWYNDFFLFDCYRTLHITITFDQLKRGFANKLSALARSQRAARWKYRSLSRKYTWTHENFMSKNYGAIGEGVELAVPFLAALARELQKVDYGLSSTL